MFQLNFRQMATLWRDDRGQDLIEYALLASMIAVAGALILPEIGVKLDDAFEDWGNNVYDAWEPEDPLPPSP